MDNALPEQHVDAVIRARATIKVMSDDPLPSADIRGTLDKLIATAGWAPFHRPCDAAHQVAGGLAGIEPWRMYALDANTCRQLRMRLPREIAGKLPAMLAAADALIQVTWLPNPTSDVTNDPLSLSQPFEPTLENMEHIAAAAAAIQNLLLAATAQGFESYWSSGGGLLRTNEVFDWLGIPRSEILLGAIFLFGEATLDAAPDAIQVGSKLRERRSPKENWMRWVSL